MYFKIILVYPNERFSIYFISKIGRTYASVTYARRHDYNRTHYEKTGINQKAQIKTKQNPKSGLYKWTGIDNKCMNNDYLCINCIGLSPIHDNGNRFHF